MILRYMMFYPAIRLDETPGYLFSPTNQYRNFIRLNAANWSDEAEQAIQRLGEMIAALS